MANEVKDVVIDYEVERKKAVAVGKRGGSHATSTITFDHPEAGDFTVRTGANNIEWSYELNTQNYPTYAGEVVQILSVYIGDVTITGDCESYTQMEELYSYFLKYMQFATQGQGGAGNADEGTAYNEQSMQMYYWEREWKLEIQPTSLPGFQYGRDVVAPTWSMTAAVVDEGHDTVAELKDLVMEGVEVEGTAFKLTGEIGYRAENPFSDPFPTSKKEFDTKATKKAWDEYGDFYTKLIPAYYKDHKYNFQTGFGSSPFIKDQDPKKKKKN